MSLTELKNLLDIIIKRRIIDKFQRIFWRTSLNQASESGLDFSPKGLKIARNIILSREGHIYVQMKNRILRYNLEKFFLHQASKLSKKDISEAIKRLRDLALLAKLEEGSLKANDVLRCRNVWIRRYLLENLGYERLLKSFDVK